MKLDKEKIISGIVLLVIVLTGFIFLVSISPYPAGDDPGMHTSLLKYMIKSEGVNFDLPFFPLLDAFYRSDRFVTNVFLTAFSKITGVTNVFALTIYFTAFCFSLSLVFIYLFINNLLKSRIIALMGTLFLPFAKWYQENFWEGSYDQYTGLLLFSAFIYLLFRKNFLLSFVLLFILYKTHQLGFLVGLVIFAIIFFKVLSKKIKAKYFYPLVITSTLLFGGAYIIIQPGYFALNATGHALPLLFSRAEGTPLLMSLILIIGLLFLLFKNKNFFIFVWLGVTFIFSQAFILDLAFYPYRFNIYLMQAAAVVFSLGLYFIFKFTQKLSLHKIIWPLILVSLLFLSYHQFTYTQALGSWITSQDNNPASVILEADVEAFEWLRDNTEDTAVALAPYKWGYYLPALAERRVVLDEAVGGDMRDNRFKMAAQAREVYTTTSTDNANKFCKEMGVDYIVWDASINRFPERYKGYDVEKFNNSERFLKVYEKNKVKIYQVL